MTEQWQELKETIIELRDNDGTGTQQEVCRFLANLMNVLEKQMQQPCEDAISRQTVIDGINEYFHDEYYQRTSIQDCRDCLIEDVIKPLPPVIPKPKTGHWISDDRDDFLWKCSNCNYNSGYLGNRFSKPKYNFCPNCGASMIEGEDKE